MQVDPYMSPSIKLQFKCIKDLHIKPDILSLVEEKVRSSLEHVGIGQIFLNRTPVTQALRSTIANWNLMKLKASVRKRTLLIKQNGNLLIGKRS